MPSTEGQLLVALDELGRVAVTETDLQRLGRFTTRVIKDRLGLAHVALALVEHERGVAVHLAAASDYEVPLVFGDTQPLSSGLVGRCAREGRTIHVSDVRHEESYVAVLPDVVAELVVPVHSQGRVTAVLNCESREEGQLADKAIFLEVAANRIGVALDNARLLAEREVALLRERGRIAELDIVNAIARIATEDLELRPMLQRITDAMLRMYDWDFAACGLVHEERGTFTIEAVSSRVPTEIYPGYGRELGSGVCGEVALTGEPILLDDTRTHANYVETLGAALSELCVPVKHGGKTIGFLNLESTHLAAFHDRYPVLQTIADQVAGAIAAARMYEELRRRAGHLEMIGEVSRHAMEAGDLQALLDRVVGYLHDRFRVPLIGLVLVDKESQEVELVAHVGEVPPSFAKGMTWPTASAGIVGRAVLTGEPQLQLDVRSDPDYIAISDAIVAEYAVPIRFGEQVLGVVNIESDSVASFGKENLGVMRTIVDQVAGAIHMAAMNRRLEDANRVLSEMFARYVAPDVARVLLEEPERFRNRGERRQASVLFADVRGFSRVAQRLGSEVVLDLLNEYYGLMGEAIFAERGSINNIQGDGLMAVFGAPEPLADHARAAVRAALEMQRAAERLGPRWESLTGAPLRIVVSINCGEVLVGNIGDPRHLQFTVLGDVVNVAARLESEAKQRGVGILATGEVVEAAGPAVMAGRHLGDVEVRGREGLVRLFEVLPVWAAIAPADDAR